MNILRHLYQIPWNLPGILKYSPDRTSKIRSSIVARKASIGPNCLIQRSTIGENVKLGGNCKVYSSLLLGNVEVDEGTALWGPNLNIISTHDLVKIGRFCSIGLNATIISHNHNYEEISTSYKVLSFLESQEKQILRTKPVNVGHDVWIGSGAIILPGSTIGTGAVVAAGSIVTGNVEPYSIVAGNPIKVVRMRFQPNVCQFLLSSRWWTRSPEEIQELSQALHLMISRNI